MAQCCSFSRGRADADIDANNDFKAYPYVVIYLGMKIRPQYSENHRERRAWQALFDHGRLTAGQTVLIHGAAGAVGSIAVQLAREAGARMIGTGRSTDRDTSTWARTRSST